MEWLEIIIMAIGLIIFGFYQHYKIKSLNDQIEYQKGILESVKIYVDIFEPEKLRGFVKISEETFQMKADREIEKHKEAQKKILDLFIQDHKKETTEKLRFFANEIINVTHLVFFFMYFVSPDDRKIVMEKSPDSNIKKVVMEQIDEFPYSGGTLPNALRQLYFKNQLKKIQTDHKKEGG